MSLRPSGIAQLAPVAPENLNQQVYAQLRQAIMAGTFRPGEAITLRRLAAAMGVSMIPARDALLRLVTERALEQTRRSIRIPVMSLEQLKDIERCRILLEGEAAALAAERATPAEVAAIVHAAERAEKAYASKKISRFVPANQEFHFSIYRAAHSETLQSIIETLWLQIGPYLGELMELGQGELPDLVDMGPHQRIVEAIRARDPAAARAALAADLEDSTDVYAPYRARSEQKA